MTTPPVGERERDDPRTSGNPASIPVSWLLMLTLLVALLTWVVMDPLQLRPVLTGFGLPALVLSAIRS